MVQVHGNSTRGLVALGGKSEENHCLDCSIGVVNFSSDIIYLNSNSSYFKICTDSDITERGNGNLGIKPSRTLYSYILATWADSDGVVSDK